MNEPESKEMLRLSEATSQKAGEVLDAAASGTVKAYKAIENGTVKGCKAIENTVVGAFLRREATRHPPSRPERKQNERH